jgi:hypothetical protein
LSVADKLVGEIVEITVPFAAVGGTFSVVAV